MTSFADIFKFRKSEKKSQELSSGEGGWGIARMPFEVNNSIKERAV